jgi:hypothetical protein
MRSLCSLGFVLLIAVVAAVRAEDPPEKDKVKEAVSENAAKAAEFATAEAVRYEIRRDKGKQPLKLLDKPVLRWSNPTAGEVHGSVVLWTQDGCPEAVASIYQFFNRKQLNVELVSLSESPLTAKRNDKVRWTPESGVKFAAIPDAPEAAGTAERRRFQMRTLAGKFTGLLAERGNDDKFTELRLMARPLHQYEATDSSGREGAVFAFVTTNDPEILLLIESRPTKSGGREWVWAAARMHYCRLQLKLGEKMVWDVSAAAPPWDKVRGPEGKYVILEWSTPEAAAKD